MHEDLVGYSSGSQIYLTIPYLVGYSHIVLRLNKQGTSANFIDTYVETATCSDSGTNLPDGTPIFSCVFNGAEQGIDVGTGNH